MDTVQRHCGERDSDPGGRQCGPGALAGGGAPTGKAPPSLWVERSSVLRGTQTPPWRTVVGRKSGIIVLLKCSFGPLQICLFVPRVTTRLRKKQCGL